MTHPDPTDGGPDADASSPAGRLASAVTAHDAGDYAAVRGLIADLGDGLDDKQQAELQRLRARTGVDPVQVGVLLACLALLCVVAFVYAP